MRDYQFVYLADVLRQHQDRLGEAVSDVLERQAPLTELEAKLLVEAGTARLREVENALRHAAYESRRGAGRERAAKVGRRIASWTKPRIGVLKHYEPRPLVVPASYFRTLPPSPAPRISIVTPSFQHGHYLDRTLYSVVAQSYPALEYVVQDGASTDETLDILRRFEPHLATWASEPDDGQADAINRGFARTSGEIMAWLNSDDLLLPGSLAYVASYFARHPEIDVVYGHRVMIDGNDGQIGAWILPRHDDRVLALADYVPQETLFWRREIWERAGGYVDTSFRYAMDWDLLLRFRAAGARMVRLPRFLGAFRIHDEQKTTAIDAVGLSEMDRLRVRMHGRVVALDEVLRALRPFFVRHIFTHSWYRAVDRVPLPRVEVETIPLDPALRRPITSAAPELVSTSAIERGAPISPVAPPADATVRVPAAD